MSATPSAPVFTTVPTTQAATGETFNLASTTVGDLNLVVVGGVVTGAGNEMDSLTITQPGWAVKFLDSDTNGRTSTSGSWVALLWKIRTAGDTGSTVTVTFPAPITGQGVPIAFSVAAGLFDAADPVPYGITAEKAASDVNYPVSGTTPAGVTGVLYYGATARTDATAWASASDTLLAKANAGTAGSNNSSIVLRYVAGDTAGGTAFSKSHTGPSTTVGEAYAFLVKNAPATGPADQSVTPGSGSLSFSGGWVVVSNATPVNAFINTVRPFTCAHRGGSGNYVEMSRDAYLKSNNWGVPALEFSTWRTADGYWVGSHDQSTLRMFGVDKDIPTSNYVGNLDALRTTTGSKPLYLLQDFLTEWGYNHILFVDNKSGQNHAAFLDILDANGGPRRIITKYFNTATTQAGQSRARGYKSWGYFYEADLPNLTVNQQAFDVLGMDVSASQAAWDAINQFRPKPIMAHILGTVAQKTTAISRGADGWMVANPEQVVPYTVGASEWMGSEWIRRTTKVWDGTAWVEKTNFTTY